MTGADPAPAERVARLLRDTLGIEPPGPDVDLFDSGLVDSLGFVTLLVELETAFGFELPLEDVDVDEFRTLDLIVAYVERAREAA